MVSALSFQDFKNQLTRIEQVVNSDQELLNENLEATKKSGFRWMVKVILSFFCPRFCYDPFADVRMNVVAQKLDKFLQVNLRTYQDHCELRGEIRRISDRIIAPLKERRTHGRFNTMLRPLSRGLKRADLDIALQMERTQRQEMFQNLQETLAAQSRQLEDLGSAWQAERAQRKEMAQDLQSRLDSLTKQLATLKTALHTEYTQRRQITQTLQLKLDALPEQSALEDLARAVAEKQDEQNGRLDALEGELRTEQEERQGAVHQINTTFDEFLLNYFNLVLGEVLRIRHVVKRMSREGEGPNASLVRSSFFAGDLCSSTTSPNMGSASNSSVNLASIVWYDRAESRMDQLESALNRCLEERGQPAVGNAQPPVDPGQPLPAVLSEPNVRTLQSIILQSGLQLPDPAPQS